MIKNYDLFINGEFRQTGKKQKVIDPSSGAVIAEAGVAGKNEVEAALESARFAFDSGIWPGLKLEERKKFILKISRGILDKAAELANLESLNSGKPIKETTFMDIPSGAKAFEYVSNNLEKFLEVESPKLEAEAEAKLIREPLGVAVLIVPWNYPLLIACWKLASALAAGNTVILKPSSLTPLTALELGKIICQAGLPKGAVNILNASGESIGRQLCSDSRVDMISFTGSNRAGKMILGYASQKVKKTIMELGGKSASIIFADADLEAAVNGSLCSIFLNQGQMCTAMSRILVEEKIYDKFADAFAAKAKRIKLGIASDFQTQIGPLISADKRKKVIQYVEKAKSEGIKLACGGEIPQEAGLKNGFFFEPTVFIDVDRRAEIFQEEVFGPVACVSKFSSQEEALELTNATDFALAACIWTENLNLAEGLAGRINAGTIWINTYGMFYNELPFGGFKQSGFGKELGKEGFLEYTRLKNIVIDKTKEAKPIVNYWYGL